MRTIIMAGGKGSRIASIARDIPKPMINVCGKPILEHQIICLKKNDLTDIIIIVGHLGQHIQDYFGNGSKFGCNISYFYETEPLGTAGALYKIKDLPNDFILLNGDIIFDIDFSRMISFHREKKAWASLAVHPNDHPFDSALIASNSNNQVTGWLSKEDERLHYKNIVNAGVHILSVELLENCPQTNNKIDLDRDILKPMIQTGKVFAYHTPEYIKDMGTPERYAQVSTDLESGIVAGRNLGLAQKAVFLDRDGTINRLSGFITRPEDFELLDGAADAIRIINGLGFLAIVITNQPVIARGDVNFDMLDLIHKKMETELGKCGAFVDDIFFCPHHPDKGFPGERPEYKIDCDCRKPKSGMILRAAKKYNVDISKSYMVGDGMRDVHAGMGAGCVPILLSDEKAPENMNDIRTFANLSMFARWLAQQHGKIS